MKPGRLAGVVGAVVIFGALAVALVIGLQTPGAQSYLQPAGDFLSNLWAQARANLSMPTTPAAGDLGIAAGIVLVGFAFTVLLATPARTGRGVIFTLLAWVVVGFLLYAPGVTR